jgi:hypothetical protein
VSYLDQDLFLVLQLWLVLVLPFLDTDLLSWFLGGVSSKRVHADEESCSSKVFGLRVRTTDANGRVRIADSMLAFECRKVALVTRSQFGTGNIIPWEIHDCWLSAGVKSSSPQFQPPSEEG